MLNVDSRRKGPALNMYRVGLFPPRQLPSILLEGHYRRSYLCCFSLFLVPPTEGRSSREVGIMAQNSCSRPSGGILSANQDSKLVRDIVRQCIYSCIFNKRLLYLYTERDLQKGARSSLIHLPAFHSFINHHSREIEGAGDSNLVKRSQSWKIIHFAKEKIQSLLCLFLAI